MARPWPMASVRRTSCGELGVRVWVIALDYRTVKLLWRASNTGVRCRCAYRRHSNLLMRALRPGPGVDVWPHRLEDRRGNVLGAGSPIMPECRRLYTAPVIPALETPTLPGDNKWTAGDLRALSDEWPCQLF